MKSITKLIVLFGAFATILPSSAQAGDLEIDYWRDGTVEATPMLLAMIEDGEDLATLLVGGGLMALAGYDIFAIKLKVSNNGFRAHEIDADDMRISIGGQSYPLASFAVRRNGRIQTGTSLDLGADEYFEGYAFYIAANDFGTSVRSGSGTLSIR